MSGSSDRVVYWGTSCERITDTYAFDSFGMAELTESGTLLYGRDIRVLLKAPGFSDLYADVKRHYETIRKYVQKTERSLYSFGWLLDIARCLYTLRSGKIIAKTAAADWALENNLCPVPDALKIAVKIRRAPLEYMDEQTFDYAETLVEHIQRFADVLEKELTTVREAVKFREQYYDSEIEILQAVKDSGEDYRAIAEEDNEDKQFSIVSHYNTLIDENNDPVHDPKPLRDYMDKWDGSEFIEKMCLDENKSVLEVGVGTGRLVVCVAPLCGEFCGIDISPKTIERARENLAGQQNISLICGDFLSYEFGRSFDVIYSSLTFMHIDDKQRAIDKIAGLLSCAGRLVLSIDKNQSNYIDNGVKKIKIYPDNPDATAGYIRTAGLTILDQYDTEFATVFVVQKDR